MRKMLTHRFIFLCVLCLLTSCGTKNASDQGQYDNQGNYKYENKGDREKALKAWAVACEDPKQCPSFVGQIVIRREDSLLGICTGFLVSRDTIVTNSHCMTEPETCGKNVTVHFPATPTDKAEVAECEKVTSITHLNGNPFIPDYAIFTLKNPPQRKNIIKIDSKSGVKNDEELRIVKIDPVENSSVKGLVKVRPMKVAYETFQTPASNSPYSSIHALMGGQVTPGNSGSPIVTRDFSAAKLVVHAILDKSLSWFPDLIEFILKSGPSVAYATNLTCIGGPSEYCDDVSEKSALKLSQNTNSLFNITPEDEDKVAELSEQVLTDNRIFGASLAANRVLPSYQGGWFEIISLRLVPGCFMDPSGWINEFKSGPLGVFGYQNTAFIRWPLMGFKKQISINEKGKIVSRIVKDNDLPVYTFKFSPDEVFKTGMGTVESKAYSGMLKTSLFRPVAQSGTSLTLGLCDISITGPASASPENVLRAESP